jgi:hypothetical protein
MNTNLLIYEIRKNNYTIQSFCEKIGMSRAAFYRKCKGISEFTLGEIVDIVKILNLKSPMEIFFN